MNQWPVWIVWTLLCTPALRADLVVAQRVEESGPRQQSAEITLKVKGDKIRVDLSPEVSLLMDTASGGTITLQHAQKTSLEVSAAASQQLSRKVDRQREEREREGATEEPARLEPTGMRETIAGQETRVFTTRNGTLKMRYWIASGNPDTDKLLPLLALLRKAPMVQLAGGMALQAPDFSFPGIPLKTELTLPDGRKITTTILSIKEQPLENLDFTVPPNYRSLPKPTFDSTPPPKNP